MQGSPDNAIIDNYRLAQLLIQQTNYLVMPAPTQGPKNKKLYEPKRLTRFDGGASVAYLIELFIGEVWVSLQVVEGNGGTH